MTAPRLLRALAVDDEPSILSTFRRAFRGELDVVTEADPIRGLERLAVDAFDVIFVDYAMPRMNGITFLEQARTIRPRTAGYLITAHAHSAEIEAAVRRGLVVQVIAKPWSRDDILGRLRAGLDRPA